MVYLKSLVFNSLFYFGTGVLVIVMGPVLLLPSRFARAVARLWGYMAHLLLAMIGIKPVSYTHLTLPTNREV